MKSHHAFLIAPGASQGASEREKDPKHKPGLLGNGKRVSFRSLVEFPFSLFIFLDLEPHVTHIARRLNKKLAKKVSKSVPRHVPERPKASKNLP